MLEFLVDKELSNLGTPFASFNLSFRAESLLYYPVAGLILSWSFCPEPFLAPAKIGSCFFTGDYSEDFKGYLTGDCSLDGVGNAGGFAWPASAGVVFPFYSLVGNEVTNPSGVPPMNELQ